MSIFIVFILFQRLSQYLFMPVFVSAAIQVVVCICSSLNLNARTMVKWIINVALNGYFALRMLLYPDKYYTAKDRA